MCRSLRETRKQLAQAADWRAELERMKTGAVVGCLHVETKTLRNMLSKIPATILQQVRGLDGGCGLPGTAGSCLQKLTAPALKQVQ